MTAATGVYAKNPFRYHEGIPVFSLPDDYTQNYEQISRDHLEVFRKEGRNPFMEEEHWAECEDSTAVLVQQYCHEGDRVLDAGVGMGRLLRRFPKLDRFGMDISFGYLEVARAEGIDVCYSKMEDMPYRDGLFDAIVCTDVLEHVLDLHAALSRIVSALKPGGVLIARVPYREDLRPYAAPSCPYRYVHLRSFDEYGIRLLVERVFGLTLLEVRYTGMVHGGGRLKYPFPIPRGSGVLRRVLAGVRHVHRGCHDALARLLYVPAEINFVARKGPTT